MNDEIAEMRSSIRALQTLEAKLQTLDLVEGKQ
jgi:hypothetical protein